MLTNFQLKGSLRFNLDPFKQHSDEQIWRSLELCSLRPFVTSLSAGLEHEISEHGSNLSLGQRQLVCLSRAILRKPKILIIDEGSAFLDDVTDQIIQKAIRDEFSESSILTVAHRLNTILDADRILVIDQGQLAEFGSPAELLKRQDSVFRQLANKAGIADGKEEMKQN